LSAVGLGDSLHKYPREMSGGMQQRVGVARAIALKPRVLLLDEPFGRLDSLTRMDLQDVILHALDQQKITTLLITHDVDEALYMSDRVCMMTNGPNARVGQLLDLPFARPRERSAVLDDSLYYELRGALVSFLEQQDKRHAAEPTTPQLTVCWDDTVDLAPKIMLASPPTKEAREQVMGVGA
jgi:nitrate/nitrite transport system ATP-binding protein